MSEVPQTSVDKLSIGYKIPDGIPRSTLYFRIAQLEQISRIRYESAEGNYGNEIETARTVALKHAEEAELTEAETDAISRVFDRYKSFEEHLSNLVHDCQESYQSAHREHKSQTFDINTDSELNQYAAHWIYKELSGEEPKGQMRVFVTDLFLYFLTDDRKNFPDQNPYAVAGTISPDRLSIALNPRIADVKILYEIMSPVPQDLKTAILKTPFFFEEEQHVIADVIHEELDQDNYVREKGISKTLSKYRDQIKHFQADIDPETGKPIFTKLWNLNSVIEHLPTAYRDAKKEILAHWASATMYAAAQGKSIEIPPEFFTKQLKEEYNFVKINNNNPFYKEIKTGLDRDIEHANAAFAEIAKLYRNDYVLVQGMLDPFDITQWPAIARIIKGKVARYGLPSFIK